MKDLCLIISIKEERNLLNNSSVISCSGGSYYQDLGGCINKCMGGSPGDISEEPVT